MKIKKMKCVGFYLSVRVRGRRERETGWARTRLTRLASMQVFRVCTHLLLLTVGFFFIAERLLLSSSFPSCEKNWNAEWRIWSNVTAVTVDERLFSYWKDFFPLVKRNKKRFILICPSLFFLSIWFPINLLFSNLLYMPNLFFLPLRAECIGNWLFAASQLY
jgi:hypothetical protein